MTMLPKEIIEIVDDLLPAHGPELVAKASTGRHGSAGSVPPMSARSWRSAPPSPEPAAAGDPVVVALPAAEVRSFDAYRIENLA